MLKILPKEMLTNMKTEDPSELILILSYGYEDYLGKVRGILG